MGSAGVALVFPPGTVLMIGIASVSRTTLAQRRQQLRQRRRLRVARTLWRVLALAGLAGGIAWGATLPIWVLQSSDQIQVEGNYYLPAAAVRSLVPVDFPQSLFRVEPNALAQAVKAKAPVVDVKVQRQLVPPALVVRVQERYPVAIAQPTPAPKDATAEMRVGLLDATGEWIPLERYTDLDQALKLPSLKVIGNPKDYQPYWAQLYQEINRSPVKISEIDWRDVTNVILKTEMGPVRIGPYGSQFGYQLSLLDRLRKLPSRVTLNPSTYINLINPSQPTLQMGSPLRGESKQEDTASATGDAPPVTPPAEASTTAAASASGPASPR
jgi:cell division protein FtsQ